MDAKATVEELINRLRNVPEPRKERGLRHELAEVLFIALAAMVSGANDAQAMKDFGDLHYAWLSKYLRLAHGIPSQDTFLRVFAMLDPIAVQEMFHKWIDSLRSVREGGHVAIDGKTLRRSFDKASGAKAIHIVSAYMVREGLVLSQLKVAEKTNEITAIPDLLNLLNIEGATVTIDAMGCQRAIAEAIVANEAHYVLAVKENQPTLHEEIREYFEEAMNEEGSNRVQAVVLDTHQEHSTGHGRREIRTCSYSRDVGRIAQHSRWSGIAGVAMIERQRLDIRSKKASSEKSYFIVSDPTATAASVANAVRSHWGIENQVHWVLDTNFSEDQSRIRVGHAAENIAVFRHLVVNLLRRAFGKRHSIAKKRQHCAWDILRTAAVLLGREVSA